jgi:hypothetical protein
MRGMGADASVASRQTDDDIAFVEGMITVTTTTGVNLHHPIAFLGGRE